MLQQLTTISFCPWANPQHLLHALPRLSTHPAEAGCPRTGSWAHPQPCRTWSTVRAAGGRPEAAGAAARQGCFWPACLAQGWGVRMLRASWSLTSAPNPSPALAEVQLEAAGPVTGRTGPWALGKGLPGLGGGCPRLPPSLGRCACPIPQQFSLPPKQTPMWLQAELSANWRCVSSWPRSGVISA